MKSDKTLSDKIFDYIGERGQHSRATLTKQAVEMIDYFLVEYFKGKKVVSVETGCGASTICFSNRSASHRVYCLDDRDDANGSVPFVLQSKDYNKKNVKFVFGPTQKTLFEQPLDRDVDVVLIDGPHAYPFPDVEYFAFYPRLKEGGVLIVDDIVLPTIHNLFRFLEQDDGYYLHDVVGATAFFVRTGKPLLAPTHDGWWTQRFNVQNFPAHFPSTFRTDSVTLPATIKLDGEHRKLPSITERGWALVNTDVISEGDFTFLRLNLGELVQSALEISVRVLPLRPAERISPGVTLICEETRGEWHVFVDEAPVRLSLSLPAKDRYSVLFQFQSTGLKPAREFKDWPGVPPYHPASDVRMLGFRLLEFSIRQTGNNRAVDDAIYVIDGNGRVASTDEVAHVSSLNAKLRAPGWRSALARWLLS
jgi:precorrin-6B methylase 2